MAQERAKQIFGSLLAAPALAWLSKPPACSSASQCHAFPFLRCCASSPCSFSFFLSFFCFVSILVFTIPASFPFFPPLCHSRAFLVPVWGTGGFGPWLVALPPLLARV